MDRRRRWTSSGTSLKSGGSGAKKSGLTEVSLVYILFTKCFSFWENSHLEHGVGTPRMNTTEVFFSLLFSIPDCGLFSFSQFYLFIQFLFFCSALFLDTLPHPCSQTASTCVQISSAPAQMCSSALSCTVAVQK